MKIFEYLEYAPELQGKFRWKIYPSNKAKNRSIAGYLNSNGYWVVEFEGKSYLNHRLLLIYFGELTEENSALFVDHIDGNRSNNNRENLRLVPVSENSKNRAMRSDNKSGITGVWYSEKGNRWCCRWINSENKKVTRSFSVEKYGELAREKAITTRSENLKGYSTRHGK